MVPAVRTPLSSTRPRPSPLPSPPPSPPPGAPPLPTRRQPRTDGAPGTAELLRGLLVGVALQVAEHERRPILLRQASDLLIEDLPQVARQHLVGTLPRRQIVQRRLQVAGFR